MSIRRDHVPATVSIGVVGVLGQIAEHIYFHTLQAEYFVGGT